MGACMGMSLGMSETQCEIRMPHGGPAWHAALGQLLCADFLFPFASKRVLYSSPNGLNQRVRPTWMSAPKHNSQSPARWFWISSSAWAVVNLLPFALGGETWGMVWFPLNQPLSSLLKESPLSEHGYPHLFVLTTTVVNGLVIGLLLAGALVLTQKMRRPNP